LEKEKKIQKLYKNLRKKKLMLVKPSPHLFHALSSMHRECVYAWNEREEKYHLRVVVPVEVWLVQTLLTPKKSKKKENKVLVFWKLILKENL